MQLKVLIGLVLLFCSSLAVGQSTKVSGRLTDKNGHPLSFGLVRVGDGTVGTTANDGGYYELGLEPGTYTISAEYMGYHSVSKQVAVGDTPLTVNFKLADQSYSLDDVVISANAEDPAIRKMRQVIAHRKRHAKLVKTLETDIYLKGFIGMEGMPKELLGRKLSASQQEEMKEELGMDSTGQTTLYLLEQQTHYYFKAPNSAYNKVQSVHTSGDPQGLGFATMPPIINIYENNVEVLSGLSSRGFISPANANAFLYYDFKFEGSYFEDDGRMISRINVMPKRKYEPCFSGTVYVVEDEWVFSSIDLTLTKANGINVLDTLALRQTYKPKAKDLWVIQSQNIYVALSIFGIGLKGNFITNYSRQKLNEPLPEDIFSAKVISSYADSALLRPTSYWDSVRTIPLTDLEQRDFVRKDSMRLLQDSLVLLREAGPRYNLGLASMLLSGPSYTKAKVTIGINPLISMLNFNHVEGLNLNFAPNLEYRIDKRHVLKMRAKLRYGFSSEDTYLKAGFTFLHQSATNRGRSSSIAIDGGRFVAELSGLSPLSEFENTITSYFQGFNFLKLYERSFFTAGYNSELGNGFGFTISGAFEDRVPLYNTTTATYQNKYGYRLSANAPQGFVPMVANRALIVHAELRYQPGWKYIRYGQELAPIASKAPAFALAYTKGIKGLLGSDADFDKWNFSIRDDFKMRLLGNIRYHAAIGGFLSKGFVALPYYNHIRGNRVLLASEYLNSFQLAPYYRYGNVANLYGKLQAEWHLGGLLTNKIPLYRRLNWPLVIGTNSLYIDRNDYYAEVFIGIENIGFKLIRILRIDFVAGYQSGLPKPSFGIRIGASGLFSTLSFGGSMAADNRPYRDF